MATPIGTLEDLGMRARQILADVDVLYAEDTRRTHRLLSALGVHHRGRLRSLHEHNEARQEEAVIEALRDGLDVALVSDAGTPVLSDPGFLVVRRARSLDLPIASVPGPSAFTAALAAAGQPPLPATLVGFLPSRKGHRTKRLSELSGLPGTLVFFLTPHRLQKELADMCEVFGPDRPATLMAEVSKRFERAEMAGLGSLSTGREAGNPRGEYVLVVGPRVEVESEKAPVTRLRARSEYEKALEECGERRKARKVAAQRLSIDKRELYTLLIENEEF